MCKLEHESFFFKRAKKLLPYIDKGEANRYMAGAIKRKKKGKQLS
jgi:hypothetical protein